MRSGRLRVGTGPRSIGNGRKQSEPTAIRTATSSIASSRRSTIRGRCSIRAARSPRSTRCRGRWRAGARRICVGSWPRPPTCNPSIPAGRGRTPWCASGSRRRRKPGRSGSMRRGGRVRERATAAASAGGACEVPVQAHSRARRQGRGRRALPLAAGRLSGAPSPTRVPGLPNEPSDGRLGSGAAVSAARAGHRPGHAAIIGAGRQRRWRWRAARAPSASSASA